ncbi:MAG: cytochrome c oxidase assembly protein [Sphingomonadaceae bacterium]|nr:cytochrome c oxidase assembly protein [Sphingomonadaceae bacterium]
MSATFIHRKNRSTGLIALAAALAMLGLGYASVPLYRLFCQVTGFNGTTQRVSVAQANSVSVASRTMSVRFDANVERGLAWKFKPLQITDTVSIGARDMAIFTAKNLSDKAITGTATFNVEPAYLAKYFNKIQCFCFTEQTLRPGQEVRMPVLYFIDPAIMDDPLADDVEQLTLSYTFHPVAGETANALDRTGSGS